MLYGSEIYLKVKVKVIDWPEKLIWWLPGTAALKTNKLECLVQSNDNAEIVQPEDRFKYVDDLSLLELVLLSGLLVEYNFYEHEASDIPTDMKFLPSSTHNTQTHINHIVQWTEENLIKLNENKCKYMIFTWTKEPFTTR